MAELVDARDLKSLDLTVVRVQVSVQAFIHSIPPPLTHTLANGP